mmetsp:Transcript_54670/g.163366  ORF Transcript_54670/g.163366 Transcript_54670/m.163366 type:complete len:274 (-) Transcript_54670:505-1326(-)
MEAVAPKGRPSPPLEEGNVRIPEPFQRLGRRPPLEGSPIPVPLQPMNNSPSSVLNVTVRELPADTLCLFRRVGSDVPIQLDHVLRNVEPIPHSSHHHHGRYTERIVYTVDSIQKGCDGFVHDEGTHPSVSRHEIRRRHVLVDEHRRRTHLDRLGGVGRLGGRAGRLPRRKLRRVEGGDRAGRGGEVGDEGADVAVAHVPAVLGPDGQGVAVGDAPLPSVAGELVVNSRSNGSQQRRLSMITAAGDQRNALGYNQASDTDLAAASIYRIGQIPR